LSDPKPSVRIDKWLWHARFFKTRGLATKLVSGGHVRVNSQKIAKAAHPITPGDALTFPQGNRIRVVRIVALAQRRGPASEAQTLYEDLTPPAEKAAPSAPKTEGKGRPTKKDRRDMRLSRDGTLE